MSVFPEPGFVTYKTREFQIQFSQQINPSSLNENNIDIISLNGFDIEKTLSYNEIESILTITLNNELPTSDSIFFSLISEIESVLGYQLDGNNDGLGGDNYNIEFQTSMLADYDNDMAITVLDLSQFIINWEDGDITNELGPFTGVIPKIKINPDGDYNYHDMGAFALMWNWYYSNHTVSFTNYEDYGTPITIEAAYDSIYFDIPSNLSAYQVQIKYTPGSLSIGKSNKRDGLFLTHQEQEMGIFTIMAQPSQDQLKLPIVMSGKDASISISYKGISGHGELVGQLTKSMTIENVPDEFFLGANYPNPFNPTTKIDYGLPEKANVSLVIFDILGREVITLVNGLQEPGYKSMLWKGTDFLGRNVGAGMYFYLLQAGDFRQTRKMILLK